MPYEPVLLARIDKPDSGKLESYRADGGYSTFERVLKDKKPDLAILDVVMPKVNGYELCRHIRRDPLIYLTPILMLSALGGEPEMAHALEQGADDYLIKPFDVGVLFSKVKSLFEKQARIMQKSQLTGLHGGCWVVGLVGLPRAGVPDRDVAPAVLSLRDHPLEVEVLHRVVLDAKGAASHVRVEGRTLRHGPAHQHTVDLEPHVVVRAGGAVALHDEAKSPFPLTLHTAHHAPWFPPAGGLTRDPGGKWVRSRP